MPVICDRLQQTAQSKSHVIRPKHTHSSALRSQYSETSVIRAHTNNSRFQIQCQGVFGPKGVIAVTDSSHTSAFSTLVRKLPVVPTCLKETSRRDAYDLMHRQQSVYMRVVLRVCNLTIYSVRSAMTYSLSVLVLSGTQRERSTTQQPSPDKKRDALPSILQR